LELDLKEPSVVWGDAQRLRQLFFVLVDNAIKYTERGGKVTISLKGEPSRAKALVADTGIGIPGKDLPHIFDRFYRVERADCKPEGSEAGTGLGLSIAQSIAKAHAGEIGVESELGLGTTFSVLLPRA
ncbi:MAG: sensor histidine kinase, partial [Acidobacteriota bacterium]